jgi:DNA-binding transcriptional LysR family regulator
MAQRPEDERAQHRIDTQMLSDMWIFRAVASSESITGAAEQLNVTQSAVSQRVLRLESRLNTPLFVREKNGLVLTEVGTSLSQALNQVAFLLNDALDDIRRPEHRTIVVSCMPSLATEWLVPKLEDFYRLHPGIEVFVRSEMLSATSKRMQAEGIELVITYQPAPPAELQQLASVRELAFPVCSRSYRTWLDTDDDAAPVLLHDDMPWGVSGATPTEWDAWRSSSGRDWPPQQARSRRFNLAQLAYHAAVFNQGVAIGRAVIVERMLGRGELVSALPTPPGAGETYWISSAQSGEVRPWTRLFANWWRDAMHETQQSTLALLREVANPAD